MLQQMLDSLLTESRLRFLVLDDPRSVHEPFLDDNRRILALLQMGEGIRAAAELEVYLLRARVQLADDEPDPRS